MPAANFYGKKAGKHPKLPRGKPFQPGNRVNPAGRPKGTLNKATQEAKAFCALIVDSEEYQASVYRRAMDGDLAPAMETMLWHYAKGKPTEHVEIVHSQARLDEIAARDPEKFTALAEQVRAAFAVLAEVEKP